MRPHADTTETGTRDFSLDSGCLLCGGDLEIRVGPAGAGTFCRQCRWISHPHMHRSEDGVHVVHPAGLVA